MDIKELNCFRQYLDTDKIAKKNIYPFVWLSGSNTLVSPIAYCKNEIILQWNGKRNIYQKWIERTVKKIPTVLCRGYLFALFRPVIAPWAVFYIRVITCSSAVLSPFLRRFIALWLGGILPPFRNK